jgi:methenyltetrahydrofolate cyclohydrolase
MTPLAISMGARLCEMTARLSGRQPTDAEVGALAGRAQRAARDTASLIDADAKSFARVIEARRARGDEQRIAAARAAAAEVPMQIAERGLEVAGLAARLAREGNPRLRGDVIIAALLAQAGVAASAALVQINLAGTSGDPRPGRAARLVREAERCVLAARQAGQPAPPTRPGADLTRRADHQRRRAYRRDSHSLILTVRSGGNTINQSGSRSLWTDGVVCQLLP